MKVGIVLPNWIGDLVMATPTLRALRKFYGPENQLIGIMRPYVAHVLAGTNWLDEAVFYDRQQSDPRLKIHAAASRLRAAKLETIILLPNSLSTGWLAWLSGAPTRLGYVRYGRGVLLTHKLYPPRIGRRLKPISAVDYYLNLGYALGCPEGSRQVELATLSDENRIAAQIWKELSLDQCRKVVAFNTGSATSLARDWPTEYFVELARRIVRNHDDVGVLVLCGPAQRLTAARIERAVAHDRVRSMADKDLSLGVAKSCIRRSQLMVSTDSGPRHIAAAFRVPTVALCGPIDPQWCVNYSPVETVLVHNVECRPCDQKICPLGHHACMRELTVERVYQIVEKKLAANPLPQAA